MLNFFVCEYMICISVVQLMNAHLAGAVGIILYSDPAEYSGGPVEDVDKVAKDTFPHTWLMPSSGLQRGTAIKRQGDPLTHGLPATGKRLFFSQGRTEFYLT